MSITRSIKIKVSPVIGTVSALRLSPADSKAAMVLAHGAGAGMGHWFMDELAKRLGERGIATLRFNFPFAEQKKGRPDSPAVAQETIAAAIAKAGKIFNGLPLFLSGKSFGGRMGSHYLAMHAETPVLGIVFFGFPLHQPGKISIDRASHLKDVSYPMLFLQGTRDALAEWNSIKSVTTKLKRAKLVKVEGADHGFKAGKIDVVSELADATDQWIENLLKKGKK